MPVPITAVSAGAMFTGLSRQAHKSFPAEPSVGVIRQGKIIADSRVRDADFYSMSGLQFVTALFVFFARTARAGVVAFYLGLSAADGGGFFRRFFRRWGGIIRRRIVISGGGGRFGWRWRFIMSVLQFNRRGGRRGFFRAFAAHGQAV